ncbi:GtrA family protein [Microbacterium sp. zg.Y625]|uniref:GtrA family protein n=1 Tax=Microbacterium jiangjiandongii TaxID=3049071 RepID=UPI00214D085D|nr:MULTISPECIES: GtrA family protein [unclassified Microbacterium]MCR2793754.1 GtrA family protein [Microbacterium sp. zg.Y625]MCR2816166.1 GtrA family protein [Microbacterium sp. zg.Y843]WIM26098.1 GtrA family protein [Microbacterium sp. zg-Y625]
MSERGGVGGFLRKSGAFLVVGGLAFVVDFAVFNLLAFGLDGDGPLYDQPLVAKATAIIVATVVTYVGNRYWTFGTRTLARRFSRYVVFVALNVVAILIQLGCLAFSRYVLGLEGPVPDNISGTLIGQALAMAFRFFTYDRWVFPDDREASARTAIESA